MRLTPREIAYVALFAALAAAAALLVHHAGSVVPFSLVPFVAVLTGVCLGPRLGAMAMLVYLIMGLIGIPVFEKPPFGGPAYILKPTFGYIIGYVLAAYVSGKIAPLDGKGASWRYFVATLSGMVVIYLCGLPYLYAILNFYVGKATDLAQVIKIGMLPFIALDTVKAVVAAVLALGLKRRLLLPEITS